MIPDRVHLPKSHRARRFGSLHHSDGDDSQAKADLSMSARMSAKPGGGSVDSDFRGRLLTAFMPRDRTIGESEELLDEIPIR